MRSLLLSIAAVILLTVVGCHSGSGNYHKEQTKSVFDSLGRVGVEAFRTEMMSSSTFKYEQDIDSGYDVRICSMRKSSGMLVELADYCYTNPDSTLYTGYGLVITNYRLEPRTIKLLLRCGLVPMPIDDSTVHVDVDSLIPFGILADRL